MTLVNDEQLEKIMNCDTVISDSSNSCLSVGLSEGLMGQKPIQPSESDKKELKGRLNQGLMDITELSPELLSAYKIVTQLMSTSNKNVNYAFMNPIDYTEPENQNYTRVIKRPMWLNKVKLKLLSGRYSTISQVIRDLRLVLENSYRFYGSGHQIAKKAVKLETMLEQKLALLPRELKEKTSLQLTTPELVTKVENNSKAINSKTTPKLPSHKDESSVILSCVRQARAKQEREARRLQMEEKRAERDATNQDLLQWEQSFYGNDLILVKKMWEVPQIGHFLYLVQTVLNIPEVSQFELERAFLTPQSSTLLASIMTSLLSSPHQRTKLDEIPSMTYKIWQSRLKMKVHAWYKMYYYRLKCPLKVFDVAGIEPSFFTILGQDNPLETKEFHELNLKQRVWLVKSMCDHCLQNHKTIQEAILDSSYLDQKEYMLGKDKEESIYIHFPQFCGQSLRVYKQYYDISEPPNMDFSLDPDPPKSEIENGQESCKLEVVENDESVPEKPEKKVVHLKEPITPLIKKRKPRKSTSWSGRRRRNKKKVTQEELEVEETEEEVQPKIEPFFELVVDNIEALRQLTGKFSGKDGPFSSAPATPSTPISNRASPSPAPSPVPDEMLLATPTSSRSTRRSKLLATIALKKASASVDVKKKREKEESDIEEDTTMSSDLNSDEKLLFKRLNNLMKELEPWEQKLDQADRKMRFKLKKEWEDYLVKGTSNDAEASNEYWCAHAIDDTPSQVIPKLEEESESSSDSFYINAQEELAKANQVVKEESMDPNEDANLGQGSSFRKTHYRRCTKRQRMAKSATTDPISSSSDFNEDSDESSGSTSSFQITVSSRGRIRKTKNLGFKFDEQNIMKSSKSVAETHKNINGIIAGKKQEADNAKLQYQWETMRQLLVENSNSPQGAVSKFKIVNPKNPAETEMVKASPQPQPILETLLASQPGFGSMKGASKTTTSSQPIKFDANLSSEPKYIQSFIQKHYQTPQPRKAVSTSAPSTTVTTASTSQQSRSVIFRQNKDGGRRIIETTFSKPGIMKTTVSSTEELASKTSPSKPLPINQRARQPCYANANSKPSPSHSTVSNQATMSLINKANTFVANTSKPGEVHLVVSQANLTEANQNTWSTVNLQSNQVPQPRTVDTGTTINVAHPKLVSVEQLQKKPSQMRIVKPGVGVHQLSQQSLIVPTQGTPTTQQYTTVLQQGTLVNPQVSDLVSPSTMRNKEAQVPQQGQTIMIHRQTTPVSVPATNMVMPWPDNTIPQPGNQILQHGTAIAQPKVQQYASTISQFGAPVPQNSALVPQRNEIPQYETPTAQIIQHGTLIPQQGIAVTQQKIIPKISVPHPAVEVPSVPQQYNTETLSKQNLALATQPNILACQKTAQTQSGTATPISSQQVISVSRSGIFSNTVTGQQVISTNSGATRRVVLVPYKGQNFQNLQPGQKIPIVLKVVSTKNNTNSPNVQSTSNSGITFAKLVRGTTPGSGASFILKPQNNSSINQNATKFVSNSAVSSSSPTLFQPNTSTMQNQSQPIYQSNQSLVQFTNSPENQMLRQMNVQVSGNNCNTIPLQIQENQIHNTQTEISVNQHQLLLNNPNLGHQMNQTVSLVNPQLLSSNAEEITNLGSLNQQPIINVGNNMVSHQGFMPCPIQIQNSDPIQYVTQMITATTPSTPVIQQTNQQVIVCSSSNATSVNTTNLYQNNQNINNGNVYFITNSGQLVAFSKNTTTTTSSLPSVSNNTLPNGL